MEAPQKSLLQMPHEYAGASMKRQDQKDLFPSTLDVVKFVPASIALSEYVTAEPVTMS